AAAAVAMDETPRRSRTQHRTSKVGTPVGAQPAEGRCGRCDQRRAGSGGDELPQAPRSFLAQFPVWPAGHLEPISPHPGSHRPAYAMRKNLKETFSGSTKYSPAAARNGAANLASPEIAAK